MIIFVYIYSMYTIYTLADPITNEIRYVGLTCKTLAARQSRHLTDARNLSKKNHRTHWLRSLLKQQLKPVIETLDEASSYDELIKLEMYWISQLKAWNFKLTNETAGGEGSIGYKHTPQALLKIRAANKKRQIKPKKIVMSKEQMYSTLSDIQSIPIRQYDLHGKLIKVWKSSLLAATYYNVVPSSIRHALKDPTRTSVNYFWRYDYLEKANKINISIKPGNKLKIIVQNINGKKINEFANCEKLQTSLNISYPTVAKYLKTGNVYKNMYKFILNT